MADARELFDGAETGFDLAERERDRRHHGSRSREASTCCGAPVGALLKLVLFEAGADCGLDHGDLRAGWVACRPLLVSDGVPGSGKTGQRPSRQRREYRTERSEGGSDRLGGPGVALLWGRPAGTPRWAYPPTASGSARAHDRAGLPRPSSDDPIGEGPGARAARRVIR